MLVFMCFKMNFTCCFDTISEAEYTNLYLVITFYVTHSYGYVQCIVSKKTFIILHRVVYYVWSACLQNWYYIYKNAKWDVFFWGNSYIKPILKCRKYLGNCKPDYFACYQRKREQNLFISKTWSDSNKNSKIIRPNQYGGSYVSVADLSCHF